MNLEFSVLPQAFAIASCPVGDQLPTWIKWTPFTTVSLTDDELSLVCPQRDLPDGLDASRNWRCLRIRGTLDLSLVGVLSEVAQLLANNQTSIFAISTYQTDWFLVPGVQLESALNALEKGGHRVIIPATESDERPDERG